MLTSKTAGLGSKVADVRTASETGTIRDLRDWLAVVERAGQLKHVDGADYDLELGAIAHLNNRRALPRHSSSIESGDTRPVFASSQGLAIIQHGSA